MAELRLRLAGSYGETDLIARFDDHTTTGQLADELEQRFDRPGDTPRSVQRATRGDAYFSRDTKIVQADLRSGDTIRLALDTGLRAVGGAPAVASLRVVSGPDAGRTYELRRGESTVGRSAKCDVTLNDEMASRKHAVLRVSDIVEVADFGSTNGVVVNDVAVSGVIRLRPADRLEIGDTTLMVDVLGGHHEAVDVVENVVEFNRPPRIDRPFEPRTIRLPSPLDPLPKQRIPMISALIPLLMGGFMYYLTRNVASIAFIALSPLMIFGNLYESRRSGRKDYAERKEDYEATLQDQIEALNAARGDEVRSRFRSSPGNDDLLQCVADLSPLLWQREPEDVDFLTLRVGVCPQQSQTTVEVGSGGRREQRQEQEALAASYEVLPPVPATIDGRAEAPIGVAGPVGVREGVTRSLILQAAVLHSPSELAIGALLADDNAQKWDWLKWLPHNLVVPAGMSRATSAVGSDDGIELLAALQELLDARRAEAGTFDQGQPVFNPHVLVLVDGSVQIERSRFTTLLEEGSRAGITLLWEAPDPRRIPNACQTTIAVEPGGHAVSVGKRSGGGTVGGIPIEPMTVESAEIIARAMSPIVDISSDSGETAVLPQSVNLVELLGGTEVLESPAAVTERWHQSSEGRALRAPVGVYDAGTLSVDLRVDGPHGLIGGTTGAGKSEFLQAYLAALAATHSPERLTFLLVDYKGGSAFGELVDQVGRDGGREWRGLPHTVGMITDLTPSLVERALVSLQAELHRRELILNEHRAKDLAEMERRGIPGTPPSLLIVVDEFAALANEVPAFVDGVVDIAQRGRSLGLHLLLATQKPGGVVTANIQANANLRVALRMASEEESQEVVRSPIAGRIDRSTPGRGVIRRGPSDLVAFQSAYVGGVTTPASSATLDVAEFALGRTRWFERPRPSADELGEVDLRRLVRVINSAADEAELPAPRRPWLDPLPTLVNLLDLPRPTSDAAVPIGLADVPDQQTRAVATFAPDVDGSLLLYGMGGTGKSATLRTIGASLGLTKQRSVVHVYGLDFAGRALDMIAALPHVGSVVSGDDYDRVTRLLRDLQQEIKRRGDLFAAAQATTLAEYRQRSSDDLARLVVLLDGYDNFTATYERLDRGEWVDLVPRLVADGRQAGLHFVITGTRRSSFPTALASQVQKRLVFQMASDDDYHAVGADPKLFDATTPRGRCRLGDAEVQIALVGNDGSTAAEAALHARLGNALESRTVPAPPVRILPTEIRRNELPPGSQAPSWLLTDGFSASGPDLSQHVLITGGPRSGKSTALASLAEAAIEAGLRPTCFGSGGLPGSVPVRPIEDLADHLTTGDAALIFIDDLEKVAGTTVEYQLQEALGSGTLVFVGTADTGSARGFDPTMKAIRSRCDVLILQPTPETDSDVFGSPLPRTSHRFPPGRGYVNLKGQSSFVQVAMPNSG